MNEFKHEHGCWHEDHLRREVQLGYGFYSPKWMTITDVRGGIYILSHPAERKHASEYFPQDDAVMHVRTPLTKMTEDLAHFLRDSSWRQKSNEEASARQRLLALIDQWEATDIEDRTIFLMGHLGFRVLMWKANDDLTTEYLECDGRGGSERIHDSLLHIRSCEIKSTLHRKPTSVITTAKGQLRRRLRFLILLASLMFNHIPGFDVCASGYIFTSTNVRSVEGTVAESLSGDPKLTWAPTLPPGLPPLQFPVTFQCHVVCVHLGPHGAVDELSDDGVASVSPPLVADVSIAKSA